MSQNPDPGGTPNNPAASPQELSELRDQNEQQLVLIAQLKEVLRKEQSTVSQDKVEEYVNALNRARAKKSRRSSEGASATTSSTSSTANIDANKKERLNLLRQQLEENKAKFAERGKSQKGIEEMVTQLQAQLKDTQTYTPPNLDVKSSIDYDEATSQKELYSILLSKEKRITELLNKSQKLEGTVLDLQENLKEKDSVLDARTKAITLMTDSLSKKGKNTLDALEETKDQMRRMQENFVTLEAEMKARQLTLLNDLKIKNFEISELQETNMKLEKALLEVQQTSSNDLQSKIDELLEQASSYISKIADLEGQKQELEDANAKHLKTIENFEQQLSEESGGSDEVAKLKMQLEESNKNMIKTRAMQKGKIKELTKKLEQFKKMNDANALIAQLQNENSKLNEKIAELEDEKGNLQLKMVDSTTSSKGDDTEREEEVKQLKEKLNSLEQESDEKNKVIEILEAEVLSLKNDLKLKNEETIKIGSQVSSEMSSICLEEQIEALEFEKKILLEQIEVLNQEKEGIHLKLEQTKKEKHDLNSKLESYIQENIELVDKLEKLSAEKVSSAESIEIVEGLTQQEKLELAAYQQRLNPEEGTLKCAEDDAPAELNESVLQLSEDTADLLHKIEMFTQERKEVMHKMDVLKEENDHLSLKVKEIENNRDILEETYEQLQNEKEALQSENEELSRTVNELKHQKLQSQSAQPLDEQLKELQTKYEALIEENDELKRTLKDFDSTMQEKYDLEDRLKDMVDNNTSLDTKLNDNLDEINAYQLTIEENKTERINSAEKIQKLKMQLEARENDIQELHINIAELNNVIGELQGKQNEYEVMESELSDLKTTLTSQINDYEGEMAQNNETIVKLNDELIAVKRRTAELEYQLEVKDGELAKCLKELAAREEKIQQMKADMIDKDSAFKTVSQDMKAKYLELQGQLENNSSQKQVEELMNKNKEQLEKMKKLAANLKKKTQAYQKLEEQYQSEKDKWETEYRNLQIQLEELEQTNANQQSYIQDLKHRQEKMQEVSLQQEMSASLHEEVDTSYNASVADDKIRELELLVETREAELSHYNERFDNLQQDITKLQDLKSQLEFANSALTDQLRTTEENLQEKTFFADQLETRLNEITSLNEDARKKLQDLQEENSELLKKSHENDDLIKKLKIKLKKAHEKVTELKQIQETVQELETVNHQLKSQISSLEDNQRHIQSENEVLQKRNLSDYEKIEADYQMQLEGLMRARNEVSTDNEKLLEKVKELQEREQELLEESRRKYEEVERDLKALKENNQELTTINESREVELSNALQHVNVLQEQLQAVELEKLQLQEKWTTESSHLRAEIEHLKERYHNEETDKNDILTLHQEFKDKCLAEKKELQDVVENLQIRISVLEFEKSTLEASCMSAEVPATTFEEPQDVAPHGSITIPLYQENDEVNRLHQTIEHLNQQVQRLKQEVQALEFAKASLEASYESAQKLPESFEPISNVVVLEDVPAQKTPQIPLFSAFAQPEPSSFFDSIQTEETPPVEVEDPPHVLVVEDGREALLQKIKALEFLLYNVDKEKEIALDQCTEMVNELTQLIYNASDVESQVVTQTEVDNPQALKEIEFTPTSSHYGPQTTPVEEEIIQPKTAYKCTSKDDLQTVEYETVDFSQQQPLIEPVIQPKHAYLGYTKEDKPHSLEVFEENDDGWGWGPEESRLEEEHLNIVERSPQVQSFIQEIKHLKETIEVLQVEREAHLEEIKQLQIKSGKIIKKYKELKAGSGKKHEEAGFFDLNETIQEELKSQVQQLEKRLKELMAEHEKEKIEKSNLLKRAEVLAAANDRMTDMKEIQDSEVLRWQRKFEEANEKLQELEWNSNDGFATPQVSNREEPEASTVAKINELEDTIKELSLDNEELQTLLEEQTIKRQEAEKNKSSGNSEELQELRNLNEQLHAQLAEERESLAKLQTEADALRNSSGIEEELENLRQVNNQLNAQLAEERERVAQLLAEADVLRNNRGNDEELENLRKLNAQLAEERTKVAQAIAEADALRRSISSNKELVLLRTRNERLRIELAEERERVAQLDAEADALDEAKVDAIREREDWEIYAKRTEAALTQQFQDSIQEKDAVITELHNNIQVLQEEVDTLKQSREVGNGLLMLAADKPPRESTVEELEAKIQEAQAEILRLESDLNQYHEDYDKVCRDFESKAAEVEQQNERIINELRARIEHFELLSQEKTKIEEENVSLIQKIETRGTDNEELLRAIESKDAEIQQLQAEISNKESEFQERTNALVNELNQKWHIQVDQRGVEIAERWKSHLDMVEKDFEATQEKLKLLVSQWETKCKFFVEENEQLRKKLSVDNQSEEEKLVELHELIADKDKHIEHIQVCIQELERELKIVKQENAELKEKLESVNIIIETTQKQFDEKREVVEEIVALLEQRALSPISYEKDVILSEFQRQLGVGYDSEELGETVRRLQAALERVTGEKTRETTGLYQVISDMEKELSVVHEKDAEIVRLNTLLESIQQEKNIQIEEFRKETENAMTELQMLRQEHSNTLMAVDDLNSKFVEVTSVQESMQKEIEQKRSEVASLNSQLLELQNKNDSNKQVEALTTQLTVANETLLRLQAQHDYVQKNLSETTQRLAQKANELEVANNAIDQYQTTHAYYDVETQKLRLLMEDREADLNKMKDAQLADLQRHYEELLSNKDVDIGTLRAQLQEVVDLNHDYADKLNIEIVAKQELEEKLKEQTQIVDEDTRQLEELKLLIEDQVAKIEELKKELFDKSNQYDSLIAEMDVSRPPVTRQPLPSLPVEANRHHEDMSEPVNRAELDIALYMLHQRDVRCEELTVELTHLLEERDTLQLRLSNAIREKEELRRSVEGASEAEPSAPLQASSEDQLVSEKSLATKLSELRNVGYKKDKTFVDEQEARRMQQLAIMQEHINDAARLPPEAAAKLVDASYTLSRDVQSPSKVLLNWLWGKSPPKASDS